MGLQFILAAFGSSIVVSVASLLWPKFINQPRPVVLQQIHDVVVRTPFGQQAANVLGVSDEASIEPFNISSFASSLVQQAGNTVTQKVTDEVTNRAVSQIISQIGKLPEAQRVTLEQAICQVNE